MEKKLKEVKYPSRLQIFLYGAYCKLFKLFFGIQPGINLSGFPKYIELGKNVRIARNVQIITRNHYINNPNLVYDREKIKIGDNSWIGANAVILPGVELGRNTVVAAGSVVNKSFPEGNYLIGGVPAKIIKKIPKN